MPLKRITKSVLLHDGMSDDVDRFLLESPAVDYAENVRFDKQGVLSKRPGFGPSELTTVQSPSGTPSVLHAIKSSLHALTDDGARSFDGSSWTETSVSGFLGTQTSVLETPPVGGMGHIDHLVYRLSGEISNYVVAYEVREVSTSDTTTGSWQSTPKHVVVQTYDPDGNFLSQERIENARSPKLFLHPFQSAYGDVVMVIYQDIATDFLFSKSVESISTFFPITNMGVDPSPTFGMECHASLIEHDLSYIPNPDFASPMWYTRLGASADGHARYHIAVDTNNERLLIFYQHGGGLELVRMNANFTAHEEGSTIQTASSVSRWEAFDIHYVASNIIYLMYGRYAGTDPRDSSVWLNRRASIDTFPNDWGPFVLLQNTGVGTDFYPQTHTHGCLASDPASSTIAWMVHDAGQAVGYDPEATPNAHPQGNQESVRDRNTGVHYGLRNAANGAAIGTDRMLPHHRLATRCFWLDSQLYAGVQQWYDCTPYTDDINFNWNNETWPSVLGAATPRTTMLAAFDHTNNSVRPVAALDPGLSKTSEYTESEFQTHLPSIDIDNSDILFINRVVLTPEDMSLRWTVTADNVQWARLGAAEHPAEAMCRVYRIAPGLGSGRGASVANMGDGLVLSAAAPIWFDGRFFGELGPLDQPEIIDVRDSRMEEYDPISDGDPPRCRINFDGIDKNNAALDDWRKFQVVVGYYDVAGNKHRSAPSTTVYVDGLAGEYADTRDIPNQPWAANWRGKTVTIYFTLPLSFLPADIEYFVEAYVSDNNDDDPVLVDTSTIDLSTTPGVDEVSIDVSLVRATGLTGGGDPWLTSLELPARTAPPNYTVGGALAADPWPAFTSSVVTSTRLWAIDANTRGRVIASKLFEDFIAPEYNSTLAVNLGDERNLTAIGSLDDKVIVFEPDDIHVIYGEGPDNRGQGQDFAVHYIATDVGCEDQESVIETPAGLIFYSEPRGFYLLDRNLQVQFIGGGIEDFANRGINIQSATLVRDRAEVRFTYSGGPDDFRKLGPLAATTAVDRPPRPVFQNVPLGPDPALTYNYERNMWLTYSNYEAAAATIYQQKYTVLRDDWSIWQEDDERFDDPTGDNRMRIITPWIKLSDNVQDYQRLYRMRFLGRYLSSLQDMSLDQDPRLYESCDIRVRVFYDYEAIHTQEKLFRMQGFGYDPFNNPPKRAERLQFNLTPNRGRCQAVKLEIYEEDTEDRGEGLLYKLGHGFEVSAIDFQIGVSDQRSLLPAAVSK